MTDELEVAFNKAMRNIYRIALSECGYKATRFLQLVERHGGASAAKQLLQSKTHPEGLTKLWEFGRLDLSMERLVLQKEWQKLFSIDELDIARRRLHSLNYSISEE